MNFSSKSDLAKPGRTLAFYQLAIASIIVIFCTILTYFIWEFSYAKSTFVGGAIGILPNVVFALKAFKYAGARNSKKVVESFFSGVKLKMGLTAVLFALAFKFIAIEPIPFFAMFCLVMVMPLLLPTLLSKKLKLW